MVKGRNSIYSKSATWVPMYVPMENCTVIHMGFPRDPAGAQGSPMDARPNAQ